MRIGIDVSLLLKRGSPGMRVYLEQTLHALIREGREHEFVLFYCSRDLHRGRDLLERFRDEHVRLMAAPLFARLIPHQVWWCGYLPPLERLLPERVDVFHAGSYLWPRSTTTPLVATLYDLTPTLYPELHVIGNRWRHRQEMRWMVQHATRLIAISNSTAADYRARFGETIPIDVVYPGYGLPDANDDSAIKTGNTAKNIHHRLGVTESPYILHVGTVEPRKNGERLIGAYDRLRTSLGDSFRVHLVFAGARGWRSDPIYARARRSRFSSYIHFTGYLSAADLAALYREATVFAYPSLYEGFGLPVLEAMAAGTPVLTSNTSALPEVAGDATVLVDPTSVDAIASGLKRLVMDEGLRQALSTKGKIRATQFSWSKAARLTLRTYGRAISG